MDKNTIRLFLFSMGNRLPGMRADWFISDPPLGEAFSICKLFPLFGKWRDDKLYLILIHAGQSTQDTKYLKSVFTYIAHQGNYDIYIYRHN